MKQVRQMSRRQLMALLSAGGGTLAASKWSKPVIKSVLLPAHAVATGGGGDPGEGEPSGPFFTSFEVAGPQSENTSVDPASKIFDLLVKPAHAGHLSGPVTIEICVTPTGDTSANVEVRFQATRAPENAPKTDPTKGVPMAMPIPTNSGAFAGPVMVGAGDTVLPFANVPGACNYEFMSCQVNLLAMNGSANGFVDIALDEIRGVAPAFNAPQTSCSFASIECGED